MDHFGIGGAIAGAARIYFMTARQTGRTTSLLASVRDGDRIIFAGSNEARRCERLLKIGGLQVECKVVDPRRPEPLYGMQKAPGRTIFDHSWVEQFYMAGIEHSSKMLDQIQNELSSGEQRDDARRPDRIRWDAL